MYRLDVYRDAVSYRDAISVGTYGMDNVIADSVFFQKFRSLQAVLLG